MEGILDACMREGLVALDERGGAHHVGVQDDGERAWTVGWHRGALLQWVGDSPAV